MQTGMGGKVNIRIKMGVGKWKYTPKVQETSKKAIKVNKTKRKHLEKWSTYLNIITFNKNGIS